MTDLCQEMQSGAEYSCRQIDDASHDCASGRLGGDVFHTPARRRDRSRIERRRDRMIFDDSAGYVRGDSNRNSSH